MPRALIQTAAEADAVSAAEIIIIINLNELQYHGACCTRVTLCAVYMTANTVSNT